MLDAQTRQSIGTGTRSQYLPAWSNFQAWLSRYNIVNPYTEVDDQIIAFYMSYLLAVAENKGIGVQCIKNARASIGYFFRLSGAEAPTSSPLIDILYRAAERQLHPKKSTCVDIDAADLHNILVYHLTNNCSLKTRMHLTVFLLMFVGLFRFDDMQHILVHEDLFRFIPINNNSGVIDGMLIFIPCSKTDQTWTGAWVAIGATGKRFCPVKLLRQLLFVGKYVQIHTSLDVGPLLRRVKTVYHGSSQSHVLYQITAPMSNPVPSISYQTFLSSIQDLAMAAIGKHIGLHAARRGGASAAAEHGVDSALVCGLGRWKQGTTYADYYVKMLSGNLQKYFAITRTIWPF